MYKQPGFILELKWRINFPQNHNYLMITEIDNGTYHLKMAIIAVGFSIWPTDRLVDLNAELRTGTWGRNMKKKSHRIWILENRKMQKKGQRQETDSECYVWSAKGLGADCRIVHGGICSLWSQKWKMLRFTFPFQVMQVLWMWWQN